MYVGIIVKGDCMEATKVGVEFVSSFTRQLLGDIGLENEDVFLQAEYLAHDKGIIFLKGVESNGTPKQIIELMAGCFEEASDMEKILKEEGVIEEHEHLEGIVMSVNNIPVLATHYSHNPEELYKSWDAQLRAEEMEWRSSL